MIILVRTKPSGLYRHRRRLGLYKVGYRERNLHIWMPSLPSTPRRVPSGHRRESLVLYLHSPLVRPMSPMPDAQGPLRPGLPHPSLVQGGGAAAPCGLPPLFPMAHVGPIVPPGFPITPRHSDKYPNHSKPFRCRNIVVQYIDIYVSTISRLLIMSPISSGTPNYLRYIKTHNS